MTLTDVQVLLPQTLDVKPRLKGLSSDRCRNQIVNFSKLRKKKKGKPFERRWCWRSATVEEGTKTLCPAKINLLRSRRLLACAATTSEFCVCLLPAAQNRLCVCVFLSVNHRAFQCRWSTFASPCDVSTLGLSVKLLKMISCMLTLACLRLN